MTDTPSSIFHLTNQEIFVVTAAHEGQVSGQVATWVMLVTLVPDRLRIGVAISPLNFTYTLINQSQKFVVNLLAEGQHDWLPLFGLKSTWEIDKFAEIDIKLTASGIPVLPGTCGWAECRIGQQVDIGDRVLYIADVVKHHLYPDRQPLREIEAFLALPENVVQALTEKLQNDAERARDLIKPF